MISPSEKLLSSLLDGASYGEAIECSGLTRTQADSYLKKRYPALYKALVAPMQKAKQPKLTVSRVTKDGQLLTPRPDWYTGQQNNKHIPLAHAVLLPTIEVSDGPGHLTQLPAGYVIRHVDGDKSNVNIENLELISRSNAARTRHNGNVRLDT